MTMAKSDNATAVEFLNITLKNDPDKDIESHDSLLNIIHSEPITHQVHAAPMNRYQHIIYRVAAGLFFLLLSVTVPGILSAQTTSDSGTITVTAEVSPTFLVEGIHDLDFGNLLQNSQKSINALTGAINTGGGATNSLPGGQRGAFVVIADAGSEVKFELELPQRLYDSGFNEFLNVDFTRLDGNSDRLEAFIVEEGNITGSLTDIAVNGAVFGNVTIGSSPILPTTSNTLGDGGEYFAFPTNEITAGGQNGNGVAVVIGGTVSVPIGRSINQYSGDITLTVEVED